MKKPPDEQELAELIDQIERTYEDEIEDLVTKLREARERIADLEAVIEQGNA